LEMVCVPPHIVTRIVWWISLQLCRIRVSRVPRVFSPWSFAHTESCCVS
jgi:hypothetical protein